MLTPRMSGRFLKNSGVYLRDSGAARRPKTNSTSAPKLSNKRQRTRRPKRAAAVRLTNGKGRHAAVPCGPAFAPLRSASREGGRRETNVRRFVSDQDAATEIEYALFTFLGVAFLIDALLALACANLGAVGRTQAARARGRPASVADFTSLRRPVLTS